MVAQVAWAEDRLTRTDRGAADWCGSGGTRPGRTCTGRNREKGSPRSVSDEFDVPDSVDEGAFGIEAFPWTTGCGCSPSPPPRSARIPVAAAGLRPRTRQLPGTAARFGRGGAAGAARRRPSRRGRRRRTAGVQPLLDALAEWRVLDRVYDGTRAANLAEYRNRHYVYQFSQAGYRAYRAVEDVLGARLEDATLSRLVLPEMLGRPARAGRGQPGRQLRGGVPQAQPAGLGAERDGRAGRPVLPDAVGDLARTNETGAEVFLAHKDALLAHLREFSSELGRYAPLLAAAVADVAATGVEPLARARRRGRRTALPQPRRRGWPIGGSVGGHRRTGSAEPRAAARPTGCRTPRSARSRRCWRCCAGSPRPAAAASAGRASCGIWPRGSVSPERRRRARAVPGGLRRSARPGTSPCVHPDPELIPTRRTWWEAPPVEVSRTLVETGRTPALHGPGRHGSQRDRRAAAARRAGGSRQQAERRGGASSLAAGRRVRPDARRGGDARCCSPCSTSRWPHGFRCQRPGHRRHRFRPRGAAHPDPRRGAPPPSTPCAARLHLDGLRLAGQRP